MARLRERDGGLSFQLRLTPKGGRDALEGWARSADGKEHLKARVRAAPEDGKANTALIALLARTLDVAKSAIHIVAGDSARLKTIAILSADPALRGRLENWGDTT